MCSRLHLVGLIVHKWNCVIYRGDLVLGLWDVWCCNTLQSVVWVMIPCGPQNSRNGTCIFVLCWEPAWNTEKGIFVMWRTARVGFGCSWLTCPITCFGITGVESTGWNKRQWNLNLQIPVFVLLHKCNIPSARTQSSLVFEFIRSDMFQTCTSLSRASSHTTTEVPVY